nr:uncharacterized protein LOC112493584 isoform X2 [Ziziphus jujuba var. spinosa]
MLLLFYNRYQITRSQLCFLFLFLGFLSSDLTLLPEDKDSYLRFGASFFRILLLGFGEIQGKRKNVDSAFVLFSLLSCPCVSVEPKQQRLPKGISNFLFDDAIQEASFVGILMTHILPTCLMLSIETCLEKVKSISETFRLCDLNLRECAHNSYFFRSVFSARKPTTFYNRTKRLKKYSHRPIVAKYSIY